MRGFDTDVQPVNTRIHSARRKASNACSGDVRSVDFRTVGQLHQKPKASAAVFVVVVATVPVLDTILRLLFYGCYAKV